MQERGLDASDANLAVVERQLASPTGWIDWHLIDVKSDRQARQQVDKPATARGTSHGTPAG